jgi:type I restriction enzyme S subunit
VAICGDKNGGAVSPMYTIVRCKKELLPQYLLYFLKSENGVTEINHRAEGAVRFQLKFKDLQRIPIYLPSISEQERIMRLLDETEALRAARARANTRMEQFVPALFQEMFGDFSKHKQVQVSEIAKVQGGLQLTPKRNNYPLRKPYLRVANVQRGYLILDEIKEINLTEDEFSKTKLEKGDILVVEGNGNPAEIGRAAIWHNQVENCVHQNHLIRIRCDSDKLLPDYLVIFLNSETGRKYFLKSGNTTSGLVTISTSVVKKCNLPLPPLALQREFAARVEAARGVQSAQGKSAERIEALYQSMLSRAFAGEL